LIANVKTTLRPADAIFWIDPKFWTNVVPYKFNQIPNVTANGVVQFGGGKNTHLEIDVDAPAGLDYVFLDKTLPFARAAGRLLFSAQSQICLTRSCPARVTVSLIRPPRPSRSKMASCTQTTWTWTARSSACSVMATSTSWTTNWTSTCASTPKAHPALSFSQ